MRAAKTGDFRQILDLTVRRIHVTSALDRAYSVWGLITSPKAARSAAVKALLDHAVGEAYAHVQGESLKAYAALLWKLINSPITRLGGLNESIKSTCRYICSILFFGCVVADLAIQFNILWGSCRSAGT